MFFARSSMLPLVCPCPCSISYENAPPCRTVSEDLGIDLAHGVKHMTKLPHIVGEQFPSDYLPAKVLALSTNYFDEFGIMPGPKVGPGRTSFISLHVI